MRVVSYAVLRAAGRFYIPLSILFAASLLATRGPGGGVGLLAGLAFALALALHVIVFGPAALRAAIPGPAARALLALGLIAVLASVSGPRFAYAGQLGEAGLFALTVGAASLFVTALSGRAPTIKPEDW